MKDDRDGFTIIELLVSIGLFAIIVPTLSIGIRNLIILNNRARDIALASLIAENKAELLRSAGYNSITTGTTDFSGELPAELGSPKSASYTVTENNGLKNVTISISYKDYSKTTSRTYQTVVGELGVTQ